MRQYKDEGTKFCGWDPGEWSRRGGPKGVGGGGYVGGRVRNSDGVGERGLIHSRI